MLNLLLHIHFATNPLKETFYSLNLNQSNFYWLNQWFAFSPVKKYISLLNQLIITNWISGKNIFTVKSVNFHWSNQWDLTDLQ